MANVHRVIDSMRVPLDQLTVMVTFASGSVRDVVLQNHQQSGGFRTLCLRDVARWHHQISFKAVTDQQVDGIKVLLRTPPNARYQIYGFAAPGSCEVCRMRESVRKRAGTVKKKNRLQLRRLRAMLYAKERY